MMKESPGSALIADNKLRSRMIKETNQWINLLFKIWHQSKKMGGLVDALKILRWCAFDTNFFPNRINDWFRIWAKPGNCFTFFNKGKVQSFESLKGKYGLNQSYFYRYLQVRHYIECNIKPDIFKIADTGIIQLFLSVCKAQSCNKIISK